MNEQQTNGAAALRKQIPEIFEAIQHERTGRIPGLN